MIVIAQINTILVPSCEFKIQLRKERVIVSYCWLLHFILHTTLPNGSGEGRAETDIIGVYGVVFGTMLTIRLIRQDFV